MAKVFFCAETGKEQRYLRRYANGHCPGRAGYHNAKTPLDVIEGLPIGGRTPAWVSELTAEVRARTDWPTRCEACDYVFTEADAYQVFTVLILKRSDTGAEVLERALPVGAVRDAWWDRRKGFDGRSLYVTTPGGEGCVDHRASNCTQPQDHEHRCWVRHGRPEDGTMHVDKNGLTCHAGAGSIIAGAYHGFLHNGELTAC